MSNRTGRNHPNPGTVPQILSLTDEPLARPASSATTRDGHKAQSGNRPANTNAGGAGRDRTDDPLLAKQVLSQLSYGPVCLGNFSIALTRHTEGKSPGKRKMVGLDRLELSTSPLSGVRSNHLSYRP